MKRKLTDDWLALPQPPGLYWDKACPGLVVRVAKNKRDKSFQSKRDGRRTVIGHVGQMSLDEARAVHMAVAPKREARTAAEVHRTWADDLLLRGKTQGTIDTQVLPGGTAYVTDIGMTGPMDSVIGDDTDAVIQRFLTGVHHRLSVGKGKPALNAIIVDIDDGTGRAQGIERIYREVD